MSEIESPSIEYKKPLKSYETTIPGLLRFDLTVNGDNRGWFKENYNQQKMIELGIPPDFEVVQNNISFNNKRGATRGLHAEPWNKFVSVANGKVFGAWVDLREGSPTYGTTFTTEIDASQAVFVPRGVANGFQALEDNTSYAYVVDDHWDEELLPLYTFVNLADPDLGIAWPVSLDQAELSEKDLHHPRLADVVPMKPKKILVTGANGQLGKALQIALPDAEFTTHEDFDITDPSIITARPWRQYEAIINAAAYTDVDGAETPEGRVNAWEINGTAVANLARVATKYHVTLVHVTSEYKYDGTNAIHTESEPASPLNTYGQSKAAGDVAVETVPKHYEIITSWVVGDGKNFVRTMKSRADENKESKVVNDQIGRLTFTEDLANGISHLLSTKAPFGTYNITNDGDPASWADIAKKVYELAGKSADNVTPTSTADYFASRDDVAPRPLQSTLNLDKIKATGFTPRDWNEALQQYLSD